MPMLEALCSPPVPKTVILFLVQVIRRSCDLPTNIDMAIHGPGRLITFEQV